MVLTHCWTSRNRRARSTGASVEPERVLVEVVGEVGFGLAVMGVPVSHRFTSERLDARPAAGRGWARSCGRQTSVSWVRWYWQALSVVGLFHRRCAGSSARQKNGVSERSSLQLVLAVRVLCRSGGRGCTNSVRDGPSRSSTCSAAITTSVCRSWTPRFLVGPTMKVALATTTRRRRDRRRAGRRPANSDESGSARSTRPTAKTNPSRSVGT